MWRGQPAGHQPVDAAAAQMVQQTGADEGAVDRFLEQARLERRAGAAQRAARRGRIVPDMDHRRAGHPPMGQEVARPVFGLGIVARAPTGRVEPGLEIDQQKRGRGHWRCTGLR
jgi:hypothetical protein